MKLITRSRIKQSFVALSVAFMSGISMLAMTNTAQALQIPYEDIGSTSITEPVFNTYTNVPNGVGNEADFVRIRPSTGDVADNGVNGVRNALYNNNFGSKCEAGQQFDIRTYIHNGADDKLNDNGNGSSVAHNAAVRMVAPLGTNGKSFTFVSTVSADGVSSVTDTAKLFCQTDKNVTLRLVPQSVKVYASSYGYQSVPDSAVNGVLPIGSRVPGSGNVWGCWADRVIVAYIVEVVEEEPEPEPEIPTYVCDLLSLTALGDRRYRFTANATGTNGATVKEYKFNFGDNTSVTTTSSSVEHTYAAAGDYAVRLHVVFTVPVAGGGTEQKTVTSADCAKNLTIKDDVEMCPVPGKGHLPKDSPDCYENCEIPGKTHLPVGHKDCNEVKTVTTLPKTGAGSFSAIFAAVAVVGTLAHRVFTLKRQ